MTAPQPLELPAAARKAVYYVSLAVGVVVVVSAGVLGSGADGVPWYRGLDALNGALLTLVGAVAVSHAPSGRVTAGTPVDLGAVVADNSGVPDAVVDEGEYSLGDLPLVPDGDVEASS